MKSLITIIIMNLTFLHEQLDNRQRDASMNRLAIDVDANCVAVYNNGRGIPIVFHSTENGNCVFGVLNVFGVVFRLLNSFFVFLVYIPELVMGHLLTGSNFDDTIAKVVVLMQICTCKILKPMWCCD
jgi:DNA gyrase/topoisomerase IV subunit B